jgi:hypothetical protein
MKKGVMFVLIFVLCLYFVNAKITVPELKESYDLGEDIVLDVIVEQDFSAQALVSAEIICADYSKVYFLKPIKLISNKGITVKTYPLETFEMMIGNCIIDVYLDSFLGARLDKAWTNSFNVTRKKFEEKSVELNETNKTNEEMIVEDVKELNNDNKVLLYVLVLIVICLLVALFYLKYKYSNKNKFNKSWKFKVK